MEIASVEARSTQRGASMLALMVVLFVTGATLLAWGESKSKSQNLNQQIELNSIQELKFIKSSLLAHASLKGLNSLTHPGNMPCPSATPKGSTPATCLNAWLGYLPIESRSTVNHLRLAVNAQPNWKSASLDKSWRYAVSPQLIQPNQLGWSQWVDWSQPSLTVFHNDQVTTGVAIAVAEGMESVDGYTVRASGAQVLILAADLKQIVSRVQKATVNSTFNTWLNQGQEIYTHENLNWNSQSKLAQPIWSECQCACTRTRCTCACEKDSWWTSSSACLVETETCQPTGKWDTTTLPKGQPLAHVCNASASNPCIFKGNSRLLSAWPVSSTLPVAAKGKACERFGQGACPLSINNTACVCDFNWPSNSQTYLADISIHMGP